MILVIGATGFLGSEICRLLTTEGNTVRAMVRETSDKSKTDNLRQLGVELSIGDLRDPSTFETSLKGIDTVITTASAMPFSYVAKENDLEKVDKDGMINFINASESAGVKHFIYTSFSGNIDADFPLSKARRAVEQHLKESEMSYTILRPGYFMQVWLTSAVGFDVENAKVQLYGDGTKPVSYISLFDVAKFAIESIHNESAKNAVLELGGPEKISQRDAVKIFEDIDGRKFQLTNVPITALELNMNTATDPMEKSFAGLMYCVANGDPIEMDEILANFTVKPTSVRDYAKSALDTTVN